MPGVVFCELGFPVILVDPPLVEVRGQVLHDVNMKELAAAVFRLLVTKPSRFTGDEVRFIRKHQGLRQADLAAVLNMANHSVVSQWEARNDAAAGMDYNTEVLLRLWMAARSGQRDAMADLLERRLKDLRPPRSEPLEVPVSKAA